MVCRRIWEQRVVPSSDQHAAIVINDQAGCQVSFEAVDTASGGPETAVQTLANAGRTVNNGAWRCKYFHFID